MGSYRLTVESLLLNRIINFTRILLETVEQSLHHSCASPIKWQGVSLPLDRQSYSRRLLLVRFSSFTSKNQNLPVTAPGRSQIQYFILAFSRILCFW